MVGSGLGYLSPSTMVCMEDVWGDFADGFGGLDDSEDDFDDGFDGLADPEDLLLYFGSVDA